jgi:hypothetical protein
LTVAILTAFRTRGSDFKKELKQNSVVIIYVTFFKTICPILARVLTKFLQHLKHLHDNTRNATLTGSEYGNICPSIADGMHGCLERFRWLMILISFEKCLQVLNISDEMLTFESYYNASTIPRNLRVRYYFRIIQAYRKINYFTSVLSSALEKTPKWFKIC